MKLSIGFSGPFRVAVGLCTVLAAVVLVAKAAAQERKTSVSPSELPLAIQEAIKKAFPDGRILRIEKEVEGKDVGQFDIEVLSSGKQYEVEVSRGAKITETKEMSATSEPAVSEKKEWTKDFDIENCELSSVGANRYFILTPGQQLTLESVREKVVITVLDDTVMVGDAETRVVEEREFENGELKEVSRNFFAICKKTGNVFYFGEDVDEYEDGKIVRHSGAWRADNKDSRAGIIMPGTILLGARHYQEIAPNALDRAEIVGNRATLKTPAGTFRNCLLVEETSGLDPNEKYFKTYAPGIGLIQDEDLLLTGYKTVEP